MEKNIAIIGMSLLFPDAVNQEEFYENLRSGRDSVVGASEERLIYTGQDPRGQFRLGAYLGRIDQFDHKFFKISRREAEFMEPTQRILLEMACNTIEHAGYRLEDFRNTDTAVYLCSNPIYGITYQLQVLSANQKGDPTIHTGALNSMISGRISYSLGLTGASVMIDTGCSSSLVALNEAAQKVLHGQAQAALVGGLVLKPKVNEEGEAGTLGASSQSGKSRAFDAAADGIGTGEGGGLILIKRLDHAIRDNDNILAVIRGIGISQDGGRCNSIAAPSPIAQTSAIRSAWQQAGIDPSSITYIETHGAGTHLGDVIEVQAITDAFGEAGKNKKFCALGAVKTNFGHIGNAAGIAGLIKAVVSLRKKELFPCLHFTKPNPFIDFDNCPVFVNTEHRPWTHSNDEPLRCGVSSFGLSGTNVHVVLEEAPRVAPATDDAGKGIFLKLSAQSLQSLKDYRDRLEQYFSQAAVELKHALFTLNAGRSDHAYRIGLHAADKDGLVHQLRALGIDESLPMVKQKDRMVILLLSPGAFGEALIEKLYSTQPVFRQTFDSIQPRTAHARTIAALYGLYCQLKSMGVAIKTVIGNGTGSLVSQVISGSITLEQALAAEAPSSPVDEAKLKKLVKELVSKGAPVFMEMGASNLLYDKLSGWSKEMSQLTALPGIAATAADPLLERLALLYAKGVTIDWKTFYSDGAYRRVEAPVYPFEKTRCWYAEPLKIAPSEIAQCLYEHGWQVNEETLDISGQTGKTLLVLGDEGSLHAALVAKLHSAGNTCVSINIASLRGEADYRKLEQQHENIDGIIHLGAYAAPYELTVDNHHEHLQRAFLSAYITASVFAGRFVNGFQFAVLTSNAGKVSGAEQSIQPLHAMPSVLLKSLLAEFPLLKATCVDVMHGESSDDRVAAYLLREMSHDGLLRFTGIRNGVRYTPVLSKVIVDDAQVTDRLDQSNGVYIVTGGASGLGFETCKALAERNQCHFIITGRRALPPTHEAFETLKAMGSSVEYFSAEAGDAVAMGKVFGAVKKKFTTVTGIIHAAGLGNTGKPIAERQVSDLLLTLSPKVSGTILLEALSRELQPGFILSYSSIAVLVPARGGADYSCANAFEDAFSHAMQLQRKKHLTINWSDWKETGLAYRKGLQRSKEILQAREGMVKGISNAEGTAAINYALNLGKPQLAVANVNLAAFAVNPFFSVALQREGKPAETPVAAVAAPQQSQPASNQSMSAVEFKLAAIWNEVLKLDTVRLEDDFYELGGHSLNITQLLNKIKKVFGVTLEMEVLLHSSTLQKLAACIEQSLSGGHAAEAEQIQRLPVQEHYDISHAQKRFWILNQQPGREAYNVPASFMLTGSLDAAALETAFRMVIERHESLRTSFVIAVGVPKQKVHAPGSFAFSLPQEDLRSHADPETIVKELVQQEAAIPFDLERVPLLRVKLFRLSDVRYVFFMNMHHIVADATSIAVIRNEALALYKSLTGGQAAALEPLAIQYRDFAAWQNRHLQGDGLLKYRNYWLSRLGEATAHLPLPADHATGNRKDTGSGKARISLNAAEVRALRKMGDVRNASLFNTILASFNVLLHKYTGIDDIIIGTPVSGRSHHELEQQVGIYLNTLLVRTAIGEDTPFATLLNQVTANTMKDLAHQLYPYDLLTEDLQQRGDFQTFNVGFTWTVREAVKESSGLDFEIEDFSTGFNLAKNDLWLFGVEMKDGLILEFLYRASMFRKETIELLLERFAVLIQQVTENPTRRIKDLHIKLEAEQLLENSSLDMQFNF